MNPILSQNICTQPPDPERDKRSPFTVASVLSEALIFFKKAPLLFIGMTVVSGCPILLRPSLFYSPTFYECITVAVALILDCLIKGTTEKKHQENIPNA